MIVRDRDHRPQGRLAIGIINNMPDGAMQKTERDFVTLLAAAADGRDLQVRHFVLPGSGRRDAVHEDLGALWNARLDGLIVTGAEPQAAAVADEPLWPIYVSLVDWAACNTSSVIWSCLAAQAAVFRVDGVTRQRLPAKLSGVFECAKASRHELVAASPPCWTVPHSRYNVLDEVLLRRCGYDILSRADRFGVDMFAKTVGDSLFLFALGHPEYQPESLFQEYRRDVRRFISGRGDSYPQLPEGYFDHDTAAGLEALRRDTQSMAAAGRKGSDILARVDEAARGVPAPHWRPHAVALYSGWISHLDEQRAARAARAAPWHNRETLNAS